MPILNKAIETFGKPNQIAKLKEELLELALELQRNEYNLYNDIITGNVSDAIIDEVADVKIMLVQFELILGEKLRDKLSDRIDYKLERLEKRINKVVGG